MKILVKNNAEWVPNADPHILDEWGRRLDSQLPAAFEEASIIRDLAKPINYRAGVNSGDGRVAAVLPQTLFHVLLQKDPDLLTDEVKWKRFLTTFPAFRAY